jgi:ABC-2 type transport system ATP-binding protein
VIEIQNLQKVVAGQTVVDIESITVEPGQVVALVGRVDSQLGVIFELLTGQARPSSGSILISKFDPFNARREFSRQVGVLFAEDNLYQRQSVLANLNFYRRLYGVNPARVQQVLDQVGLADQAEAVVGDMNPGLARRLAVGRAILHDPPVLILNEPFIGCDAASVNLISSLISQRAQDGAAVLILAQDDEQLLPIASIVYRIDQGQVVEEFYPGEEHQQSMPFKIPAKLEHTVALVDPAEIYYAFTQDDRTFLQTADGSLPTQFTMTELERRLSRSGFFRAHRSYLVNLQLVREVIPYTRDSYSLRLKDPEATKIPLSKSAARELRDLMGY